MSLLEGKHLIAIGDLTKKEITHILTVAKELKARPEPTLLNGSILGVCFFEPSTRTRLSFEAAMQRLGGGVIIVGRGITAAADPLAAAKAYRHAGWQAYQVRSKK